VVFRWFRSADDGLAEVEDLFSGMLTDGRHVFDLAMSVRVAGADPDAVAADLEATEERTDETERKIRRRILVHASVHGASDIAASLLYMSVAKDAERVSDLSKNIYSAGRVAGPPPEGEFREDLQRLWDEISPMITDAAMIFADEDVEAAERFILRAREVQDHCLQRMRDLLAAGDQPPQPAALTLTYRYLGRIVANLLNIVSAVVMPLDQLDYPTLETDKGEWS
jgi:phosphate uptake regulator